MLDNSIVSAVKELAAKYGVSAAPVKTVRHGEHVEIVIPVGKDECAYLSMPIEAYNLINA